MTSEARPAAGRKPSAGGSGTRLEVAPHHCFACGTLNANGMGLVLHVAPGRAWTDLTLEPRFQGWDGIAHGGILCTVLDEVMAWSLAADDDWGVTARMSVDFRRPVPVGTALHAEGWVTRSRRRLIDTEAIIREAGSDVPLVQATGVYVAADPERTAQLRARYLPGLATPDTVDDRRPTGAGRS